MAGHQGSCTLAQWGTLFPTPCEGGACRRALPRTTHRDSCSQTLGAQGPRWEACQAGVLGLPGLVLQAPLSLGSPACAEDQTCGPRSPSCLDPHQVCALSRPLLFLTVAGAGQLALCALCCRLRAQLGGH